MNHFMYGFLDELEKCGARVYMRSKGGKPGLEIAPKKKGRFGGWVNYIPDQREKEIFHQPDVRKNIAGVVRTLRKDPGAGHGTLKAYKREVPLTSKQTIKVLRKKGKHFARGPAGKMEAMVIRIGKKK